MTRRVGSGGGGMVTRASNGRMRELVPAAGAARAGGSLRAARGGRASMRALAMVDLIRRATMTSANCTRITVLLLAGLALAACGEGTNPAAPAAKQLAPRAAGRDL